MSAINAGKWKKYKILQGSAELASTLPETQWFTEHALWDFIGKYGSVILKPSGGGGGAGVMRVTAQRNNLYEVHAGNKQTVCKGQAATLTFVKQRMNRPYLVQRRILLATVNNRPFDLRVVVQRHGDSPWQVTGKLAKVAGKGFIVTNVGRSNGTVLTVRQAIQQSQLHPFSAQEMISRVERIALLAAVYLSREYPEIRMIGLDMGFDQKGNVWIIEANFRPMRRRRTRPETPKFGLLRCATPGCLVSSRRPRAR